LTYSNESKMELLGVPPELLERHGAVSEEVARAMAQGARRRSAADYALAVTGIAGPTGGTSDKPVGLTYIAMDCETGTRVKHYRFLGNRGENRLFATHAALNLLRLGLMER
ncbi:MAG: CinA family protein, partial [bacterium]